MAGAGECKEEKSGEVRNSCDVFSVWEMYIKKTDHGNCNKYFQNIAHGV